MSNICPVCGFSDLDEPAYYDGLGSLEFCPCCGFQFGITDDDRHITFEQWRQKWISEGMKWDGINIHPPKNWNPEKQLISVTKTR